MRESWRNLIDLVVNPKATFTRLKSKPKYGVAFFVFCFLVVLLAWIVFPFTQKFVNPEYASSLADVQLFGSTKAASMGLVAVSGIALGILCAVTFSAILIVVSRVFEANEALKFKHVFAAWWHTILINPAIFFINVAFVPVFRRVEDIETLIDLRVIPGLHMLVPTLENQYLLVFLSFVDILAIWNIFVLTVAVATLAEVRKTKACLTAVIIWLLRVGIDVIFQVGYSS
ncbi:MAG: YIP1 family protein [Candidatus Poribacteria bacterium]|nr:YIP1 family protein [Candidatus Poribacteria bacterium]